MVSRAMLVLTVIFLYLAINVRAGDDSDSDEQDDDSDSDEQGDDSDSDEQGTTTPKPQVLDVRLPLDLYPVYYDVELTPNMYEGPPESFTFDGKVRIQIRCDKPTDKVILHTNKLNITSGTVNFGAEDGKRSVPSIVSWQWEEDRQFMVIKLDAMLKQGGLYDIQMSFVGPLKADLQGLYLSRYERNNNTVYLATSQFQPSDARKAFPCFDEPAIKSNFNITLVRKKHLKSISNMPITRQIDRANDMVADVYESTPKMSTYLLAFIVCDFEYTNATTKNDVLYRAWSRPGSVGQTSYALDVGVKILTFFAEYFDIKFPLPKQDMIAIPDFAAGAMENWGLITYRETLMLYEPGVSSLGNKANVAIVVTHELAHQWFGNLVTPSWWDDLWLNEGFATYMSYMGADFVHPDWKMFELIIAIVHGGFDADGLVSSHPLYVPVTYPYEIYSIFDMITYAKGASLIRMMRFFLGDETFRLGLTKYLERKAYDAAFHDDLWQALTEQSATEGKNINVKDVMDTWLLQMNYPVVMVTRKGNTGIQVTQERYLRDPEAVDPGKYESDFGYKWEIPFSFTSSKELIFDKTDADITWIRKTMAATTIVSPTIVPDWSDSNSWILANPMQYGYYRVNYETQNWQALINQLKTDHTKIHPINRAQIINDAWNLAKASRLSQSIALQTLEYLDKEMDYIPRITATRELDYVDTMLSTTDVYSAFEAFMKSKIENPFNSTGMDNTGATPLESFLRTKVASTACNYGVQGCIEESLRLYRQWMNNSAVNPIDPGIRDTVYCTAIRHGGVAEWDFAFTQYKTATVAAESARLLSSMGCSRESWILSRFLDRALTPDQIRKQDGLNVLVYVSRHSVGQKIAWDFFKNSWDTIRSEYLGSIFAFTRLVGGITAVFNTKSDLEQLTTFIDTHPDQGAGERAFAQAVEKTQANIKWMESQFATVKTWLADQGLYKE